MKKFLFLIFITSSFFYSNLFSNSLSLSKKDIVLLKKIRMLHDDTMMKYTLMALAIKESSIGKFMVNSRSSDYGLFQANIKTVLSRENLEDTYENRQYLSNRLVYDVGYATHNAIKEMEYWLKVHKNNWFRAWASYNVGWKYNSKTGNRYFESIATIIHALKNEYKL